MNTIKSSTDNIINLGFISIVMLWISLFLLSIVALEGSLGPISLFFLMCALGFLLITVFSNMDEIFLKIKLFVFFFSLLLVYTLINHYALVSYSSQLFPFVYPDGITFYTYSDLGLPYISGEKNFFDLFTFAAYPLHDVPLHVAFSSTISYFSTLIDGSNTVIIQKMLSPFMGGMFSVVLYSTLKYQFKDTFFALKATFAYSLFSAMFFYSTLLLRDTDIALTYMIFIYIFLQPNSYKNFFLLFLIAFITTYIRLESGMVLYGIALLYVYLYIRKIQSISMKSILYMLMVVLFLFILLLMSNKIIGMIGGRDEMNTIRAVTSASEGSFGLLINKLPFPLDRIVRVCFSQLQPFPFSLRVIDRPAEAISGIFWPFISIMMLYAVAKKNIRMLFDEKVKYLLIVAIVLLLLMSSQPMARRMMSIYPVIYIISLYVFFITPKNEIKKAMLYYIFGIILLNTLYHLLKV